jgi:hypothetical protein
VLTRRAFVLGVAAPTLVALSGARAPARAPRRPSDIQFDVEFAPARTIDGVVVRFPPVYTSFVTVRLRRRPTRADRERFGHALAHAERRAMVMVGYGLPYFRDLDELPRLRSDRRRSVLEEAVPGPTDPPDVVMEDNDMVLVVRADALVRVEAAVRRLVLPGLMRVTSRRLMFVAPGLPRRVADAHSLPYAASIDPRSPLWMGFADQQVGASGPPPIVTFAGNASARETTARHGDPFDNGSILHLSHLVEDLAAFYAEPPAERVQLMFRSNPAPAPRVYLENAFRDAGDAERAVAETGRVGHVAAVQRTSRAADGTPLHIRLDGPGFDALDVAEPAPKLHFAMLVPSSDRFARLRQRQGELKVERNGIERFIRATRRQNFVIPPRRRRVFP